MQKNRTHNKLKVVRAFFWLSIQLIIYFSINTALVAFTNDSPLIDDVNALKPINVELSDAEEFKSFSTQYPTSGTALAIEYIPLKQKYQFLAQEHYADNIEPFLPLIDKVLVEKGLDNDGLFVQGMFYVGQHESHWRPYAVSSFVIAGENPTGIFQFLPSTFRSVSSGDIFNPEDQIRAFVTMVERDRIDEYHVMFVCSYPPCLSAEQKVYMFSFAHTH
jgi:hypothetical protein